MKTTNPGLTDLVDSDLRKILILLLRNDDLHVHLRVWIPLESNLFFLSIQVKYQSWQDQAVHRLRCMIAAG